MNSLFPIKIGTERIHQEGSEHRTGIQFRGGVRHEAHRFDVAPIGLLASGILWKPGALGQSVQKWKPTPAEYSLE
jgi:hypothetical protein